MSDPIRTTSMPGARSEAVDLVKTVAIVCVLLTHVGAAAYGVGGIGSAPWLWALGWGAVCHDSVPLFLMASGALLLDPARSLPLKKLYGKNFLRLLAALLFWAMCYQLFACLPGGLTAAEVIRSGKEVLAFHHEEHLYYLHIMLLVYAFLPLTRLVAERRHLTEYALALWFLLGILYPTVQNWWPFTLLRGIPRQYLMNMTYASIGYTLLGRYVSVWGGAVCRGVWLAMALAGGLTAFFGSWQASLAAGSLDLHLMEGMGVPMCLMATGVYGLCQDARLPARAAAVTEYISRASFCVFLVHLFFLKTLAHFGVTAQMGPAAVTVPALSLALLGCGCAVYAVLRRIPVVNRYLV